jgi:hypothetical protein
MRSVTGSCVENGREQSDLNKGPQRQERTAAQSQSSAQSSNPLRVPATIEIGQESRAIAAASASMIAIKPTKRRVVTMPLCRLSGTRAACEWVKTMIIPTTTPPPPKIVPKIGRT